jgi:hypothetical protein
LVQGLLPLWGGKGVDDLKYGELQTFRAQKYQEEGPALVERLLGHTRSLFEPDPDDDDDAIPGILFEVNQISITLASLCDSWQEFSETVLDVILTPLMLESAVNLRRMKEALGATLLRCQEEAA